MRAPLRSALLQPAGSNRRLKPATWDDPPTLILRFDLNCTRFGILSFVLKLDIGNCLESGIWNLEFSAPASGHAELVLKLEIGNCLEFGIWNFLRPFPGIRACFEIGYWELFGIWNLGSGILCARFQAYGLVLKLDIGNCLESGIWDLEFSAPASGHPGLF